MFRRISTKWVMAVLATVVVPFVGFAWFVDGKLAQRLSWDVVHYYLLSLAADLADRIDEEVRRYREDMEQWADNALVQWAADASGEERRRFASEVERELDRFVLRRQAFDLVMAIDARGDFVLSNRVRRDGEPIAPSLHERWRGWEYLDEPWFQDALQGHAMLSDHHVSPLFFDEDPPGRPDPANYHIGFAAPVYSTDGEPRVLGVVYGLVNWNRFQNFILNASRRDYFQGLIGSDLHSSSYAWLWMSDADTILAHPSVELHGSRVSQPPVELPQLVEAARATRWGMYPEYEFRGELKNGAFKHCRAPAEGGFGWVVGIGINNDDIFAVVNELRGLLVKASAVVLLVVVVWTAVIARRTTRPIQDLEQLTRRIASGDLDARIPVDRKDELGRLAEAFNRMTADLSESREQLVKAEKEAAWREMARQVAHEIKNPLTPISVSAYLLKRARDEQSPEFDKILDRTIDLIQRQVENMRRIATDFYAFAGEHRLQPRNIDLREAVDEVLTLNAAWARELDVEVEAQGAGVQVHADPGELRRVLINLVTNALEAMPEGGRLSVEVAAENGRAHVDVRDTGTGLTPDARERLFEPYFTTRTHGTGLGLAICKRIVDQMGGEISIEPAPAEDGGGTQARVVLPRGES